MNNLFTFVGKVVVSAAAYAAVGVLSKKAGEAMANAVLEKHGKAIIAAERAWCETKAAEKAAKEEAVKVAETSSEA